MSAPSSPSEGLGITAVPTATPPRPALDLSRVASLLAQSPANVAATSSACVERVRTKFGSITKAFQAFDRRGGGHVNGEDLRDALGSTFDIHITGSMAAAIVRRHAADGAADLDFSAFGRFYDSVDAGRSASTSRMGLSGADLAGTRECQVPKKSVLPGQRDAALVQLVGDKLREHCAASGEDPSEVFVKLDYNRKGTLTPSELALGLSTVGLQISSKQLSALMRLVDTDHNDAVDYVEFCTLVDVAARPTMPERANAPGQSPCRPKPSQVIDQGATVSGVEKRKYTSAGEEMKWSSSIAALMDETSSPMPKSGGARAVSRFLAAHSPRRSPARRTSSSARANARSSLAKATTPLHKRVTSKPQRQAVGKALRAVSNISKSAGLPKNMRGEHANDGSATARMHAQQGSSFVFGGGERSDDDGDGVLPLDEQRKLRDATYARANKLKLLSGLPERGEHTQKSAESVKAHNMSTSIVFG